MDNKTHGYVIGCSSKMVRGDLLLAHMRASAVLFNTLEQVKGF